MRNEFQLTIQLGISQIPPDNRRGVSLVGFLISDKEPPLSSVRNTLSREWHNTINMVDMKIAWSSPDIVVISVILSLVTCRLFGPFSTSHPTQFLYLALLLLNESCYNLRYHIIFNSIGYLRSVSAYCDGRPRGN